jgi:hypothetical protein
LGSKDLKFNKPFNKGDQYGATFRDALDNSANRKLYRTAALLNIRATVDPKLSVIERELSDILGEPIQLMANMDTNYLTLRTNANKGFWGATFGTDTLAYFEAVLAQIELKKWKRNPARQVAFKNKGKPGRIGKIGLMVLEKPDGAIVLDKSKDERVLVLQVFSILYSS